MSTNPSPLYPELLATVQNLSLGRISPGRGKILDGLAAYIQAKVSDHQPVRLSFICTHNSRRSHFSQVWAQALAHYFNIGKVSCYSGGTEATALFPTVAETLAKQGFRIQQLSTGGNPVLAIKFADDEPAVIGFSKTLDDAFNPRSGFAAIMTCDAAHEACPLVPGAEIRIPITYGDPKAYDSGPQQAEKYLERSREIAAELFHMLSQIKS